MSIHLHLYVKYEQASVQSTYSMSLRTDQRFRFFRILVKKFLAKQKTAFSTKSIFCKTSMKTHILQKVRKEKYFT